jgi:hypothetical protein
MRIVVSILISFLGATNDEKSVSFKSNEQKHLDQVSLKYLLQFATSKQGQNFKDAVLRLNENEKFVLKNAFERNNSLTKTDIVASHSDAASSKPKIELKRFGNL